MKTQTLPTLEQAFSGTLFGSSSPQQGERIVEMDPKTLEEINDQPFRPYDETHLADLIESIRNNGQQQPCIVREKDGHHIVLAGRNRKRACETLGIPCKCILRTCSDAEAALILTDTNLYQRQELLPSELARAYKMQREAYLSQGIQNPTKRIAESYDENARTIQRYLRLADLPDSILSSIDAKLIPMGAGITLSYAPEETITSLSEYIEEHPTQKISNNDANDILASEQPPDWETFFLKQKESTNDHPAECKGCDNVSHQRRIGKWEVAQILPPAAGSDTPTLCGKELEPGAEVKAYMPGGWKKLILTRSEDGTWNVQSDEFADVCPIGLWCRV